MAVSNASLLESSLCDRYGGLIAFCDLPTVLENRRLVKILGSKSIPKRQKTSYQKTLQRPELNFTLYQLLDTN